MLRVLDLFSGIGAFSLGLERAGMRTVAFCEIEPFARRVLAKHWPDIYIFDDVRTLSAQHLTGMGIGVDVICGGFPCQDISVAGRGAGIGGERSGLWSEFARIIGEVGPRYVIVENVAALLGRGLGDVLGDLASLGYDAEWHCIPAAAVGAPHIRDRIWIVAYAARDGFPRLGTEYDGSSGRGIVEQRPVACQDTTSALADTEGSRGSNRAGVIDERRSLVGAGAGADGGIKPRYLAEGVPLAGRVDAAGPSHVAHADGGGWREQGDVGEAAGDTQPRDCGALPVPGRTRLAIGPGTLREWSHAATTGDGWWATEPDVGRVVDGPAGKVDRRKRLIGLGNSLVPQIPELIGRAIIADYRLIKCA
jgi:DNA (cytosine-5)-methyltransferase 1